MQCRRPGAIQPNPAHESEIISATRCDDIVDSVIEDSNRTCELVSQWRYLTALEADI